MEQDSDDLFVRAFGGIFRAVPIEEGIEVMTGEEAAKFRQGHAALMREIEALIDDLALAELEAHTMTSEQ